MVQKESDAGRLTNGCLGLGKPRPADQKDQSCSTVLCRWGPKSVSLPCPHQNVACRHTKPLELVPTVLRPYIRRWRPSKELRYSTGRYVEALPATRDMHMPAFKCQNVRSSQPQDQRPLASPSTVAESSSELPPASPRDPSPRLPGCTPRGRCPSRRCALRRPSRRRCPC